MHKKLSVALWLLLLPLAVFCKTVNIYHTSDTHGFYFPRVVEGKPAGGFAALAAYIAQDAGDYLLLDSGDFSTGTAEAKETKGQLSIQFMNLLRYHGAALGNHESNHGQGALEKMISNAEFDILGANIYDTRLKTYPAGVKPFKIYLSGGKKIAVIGLSTAFDNNMDNIKQNNPRKALKKILPEVLKQKPDAVILIAHMSSADDKHADADNAADVIKGLDINLVLGGHAHQKNQNKKIGKTVFAESGTQIAGLTKATLDFDDESGRLKDITTQYIALEVSQTGEEPYIKEFAEANRNKILDMPAGAADETIYKYLPEDSPAFKAGHRDSPLANIFADLLRAYTNADIGLLNTGNVRRDLLTGEITNRDVAEISPFPNKVMTANVSGAFLLKLAQAAMQGNKSLFQYSGMEVIYKMNPKGKIEKIDITINGKPLETTKMYSVALADFIAMGNSEGAPFKKIKDKAPFGNKTIPELFTDFLKQNPDGIKGVPTGRIIKK